MKILPIAFDSLGVRSMATYIETNDVRIVIDPGVSVSPDRYSLPPHRIELDRRREMLAAIKHWTNVADIVIITHYHYDHHNPDDETLYQGKEVLLKHPRESINQSQKQRAEALLAMIEPCAKKIDIADEHEFNFGATKISFSKPVFHGLSARLGYVIEVLIDEQQHKLLFTSDVQGLLDEAAIEFIMDKSPDTIILDGPATYLLGTHYKKSQINQSIANIKEILSKTTVKDLIIDHHLLRDIKWADYIHELTGLRPGVKICSAAGYIGKQEDILEARRQELYQGSSSG
jgi:predicted metallo-beta-lactamase superfamily hydrolase